MVTLTLRTQPGALYSSEITFSLCFKKKYAEDLPPILGLPDILNLEKLASLAVARGSNIPPNLNYQHHHIWKQVSICARHPTAAELLWFRCRPPETRVKGQGLWSKQGLEGKLRRRLPRGSSQRGHGGPVAPSTPPLSLGRASQDLKSWCKKGLREHEGLHLRIIE